MPVTAKDIKESLWKEDFRSLFPELKTEINKYFAAPKCGKCWTKLLENILLEREKVEGYFKETLEESINREAERTIPKAAKIRGTRGILDKEDRLLIGTPELTQALWSKDFREIFNDDPSLIQSYYSTSNQEDKNTILKDLYHALPTKRVEIEAFYKVPICFYEENKEFFDREGNQIEVSLGSDTPSTPKEVVRNPDICGHPEKKVLMSLWVDQFRGLFPDLKEKIETYLDRPKLLSNRQELLEALSARCDPINRYFSSEITAEKPEGFNGHSYGDQEIKDALWMRSFRDLFPDLREIIKKYFLNPKDEDNFRTIVEEVSKYPDRLNKYFNENTKQKQIIHSGKQANSNNLQTKSSNPPSDPRSLTRERLPKDRHCLRIDMNRLELSLKRYPPPKFIIESLTILDGIDRGKAFVTLLEF